MTSALVGYPADADACCYMLGPVGLCDLICGPAPDWSRAVHGGDVASTKNVQEQPPEPHRERTDHPE